jgi:hypothetical protein
MNLESITRGIAVAGPGWTVPFRRRGDVGDGRVEHVLRNILLERVVREYSSHTILEKDTYSLVA